MSYVSEHQPYLTPADINRLKEEFTPIPPESKLLFPSGFLLVADPYDLGYKEEIQDHILGLVIHPTHDKRLTHQRLILFPHSVLYLPGADGNYFVYKDDETIHIEDTFESPSFDKTKFEVFTETATLLIGDLEFIKGELNHALLPRDYWPLKDHGKVPSTPYGQVLEVSKNFRFDPSFEETINGINILLKPS